MKYKEAILGGVIGAWVGTFTYSTLDTSDGDTLKLNVTDGERISHNFYTVSKDCELTLRLPSDLDPEDSLGLILTTCPKASEESIKDFALSF